jgi:hypothetical protein
MSSCYHFEKDNTQRKNVALGTRIIVLNSQLFQGHIRKGSLALSLEFNALMEYRKPEVGDLVGSILNEDIIWL